METKAVAVRSEMNEKLNKITSALKTLKEHSETPYKTNGKFAFAPNNQFSNAIDIHSLRDLQMLISILAFLTEKSEAYTKSASLLELKNYPQFQWLSFSYDQWLHDIKIRVAQLTQHLKIEKLKKAKNTLEQFMTEEDRIAAAMRELDDLDM